VVVSIALRSVSVIVVFLSKLRITRKRRLISGAFFVCALFVSSAYAEMCVPANADRFESVGSVSVVDGDTLRLSTGDSVRLSGVNTPEMNYGQNRVREPFAVEATDFVERILAGRSIYIEVQGRDKYQRLIADVWFKDFSGWQMLSSEVLKAGFGFQIFESDSAYAGCLNLAEQTARAKKLGVWSRLDYWLNQERGGFVLWRGAVQKLNRGKHYSWARISNNRVLRIPSEWLKSRLVSKKLSGGAIEVRGWSVHRKKTRYEPYMLPIKSPQQFQFN